MGVLVDLAGSHRGVDQAVPNAVFPLKPEGFHFSSESP